MIFKKINKRSKINLIQMMQTESAAKVITFRENGDIFLFILSRELCKVDKMPVRFPFFCQDRRIGEKISKLAQVAGTISGVLCFEPGKLNFCVFNIDRKGRDFRTEDDPLLQMPDVWLTMIISLRIVSEIAGIPFQILFLFLKKTDLLT